MSLPPISGASPRTGGGPAAPGSPGGLLYGGKGDGSPRLPETTTTTTTTTQANSTSQPGLSSSPSRHMERKLKDKGLPKVRVLVQQADGPPREVFVAIGQGRQTCRWLANAAQQTVLSSNGRLGFGSYHRDKRPTRLTTTEGKLVNPKSRVKDVAAFAPERTLVVALTGTEPQVSDGGSVVQTLWEAEAYNRSGNAKLRTLRIQEDERARWEAEQHAKFVAANEETARRVAQMERMLISDLSQEAQIKRVMEAEWTFVRTRKVTSDPVQERALKELVLRHFAQISDLYKHYCGASDTGSTSLMSFIEWQHCVLSLPGAIVNLGVAKDAELVEEIFKGANASRMATEVDEVQPSLTRNEFTEALILLAMAKFGRPNKATSGGGGFNKESTGVWRSPSEAFGILIRSYLEPAMKEIAGDSAREALSSEPVRQVLVHIMAKIRRVFVYYAVSHPSKESSVHELRDKADDVRDNTMSLPEFLKMLHDAGLLTPEGVRQRSNAGVVGAAEAGGSPDDAEAVADDAAAAAQAKARVRRSFHVPHVLSVGDARKAFSGVQLEDSSSLAALTYASPKAKLGPDEEELAADNRSELILSEMLHALSRVALVKYDDEAGVIPEDKVIRVLKAVAKLDPGGIAKFRMAARTIESLVALSDDAAATRSRRRKDRKAKRKLFEFKAFVGEDGEAVAPAGDGNIRPVGSGPGGGGGGRKKSIFSRLQAPPPKVSKVDRDAEAAAANAAIAAAVAEREAKARAEAAESGAGGGGGTDRAGGGRVLKRQGSVGRGVGAGVTKSPRRPTAVNTAKGAGGRRRSTVRAAAASGAGAG